MLNPEVTLQGQLEAYKVRGGVWWGRMVGKKKEV